MNDKENSYYPLLTKDYGKTYITEFLEEKNNKIDKLQCNWNSLREWLKEYSQDLEFRCYMDMVLDKMNELEGRDNN